MFKTKTKLKLLIALVIMLLAVCVLNINTVNAATQEELQAMLDVIPNEITLDIPEIEYEKTSSLVEKKVREILKNNNLSTEGIEIYVSGAYLMEGHFYPVNVYVGGKVKTVTTTYNNTNQRNASDEKYVENINLKQIPTYFETTLDYLKSYSNIEEIAKWFPNYIEQYYKNQVSDSTVTVKVWLGAGSVEGINLYSGEHGFDVGIFKNEILYKAKSVGNTVMIPVINVPNTISDDKLNDYVVSLIKNTYSEYGSHITGITKGANGEDFKKYANIPNIYTVNVDTEDEAESLIVIRKNNNSVNLVDSTTNIKLETSEGVVPSNTVLKVAPITEGTTLDTVKKALSGVKSFKVFDINLLSDGAKIQPNGKVKISIPVPTEYNKSNLVVYRVADNGDKTEYAVTVNGDVATFETDHFSTYVLAEKEVAQNTENTNNTTDRKKDDTPKTGTTASIYFMIPVAIISATGIIAFRRKETK